MILDEENKGCDLVQKIRQSTLKLALAFSLKLQKKMETLDKEVMHSFYSGQSVGWVGIILSRIFLTRSMRHFWQV